MNKTNVNHDSGCIQSESGCETKCVDWCFFRQPDSEGNTWCIMCGNAGGANVITEPIDITGTTLKEGRTIKPAAKSIDILTKPIDITEEEHEPAAKLVTVSPNHDNGSITTTGSITTKGSTTTTGSLESIIGSCTTKTFGTTKTSGTTGALSLLSEA